MDLREWILIDGDEFLDQHGEKKALSLGMDLDAKGAMHRNHFKCPSSSCHRHLGMPENSDIQSGNQLVSVPVKLELAEEKNPELPFTEEARDVVENLALPPEEKISSLKPDADHDKISLVYRKLEENEIFWELDLERSLSEESETQTGTARAPVQIEDDSYKDENLEHDTHTMATEHEKGKKYNGTETKQRGCSECGGLNIWRWKENGTRAIFSVGAATAAVVCIIIFRNHGYLKQQQSKSLSPVSDERKENKASGAPRHSD